MRTTPVAAEVNRLEEHPGLDLGDFRLLASPPCNASTRTSQASAWFNGGLIVGTGRPPLRPYINPRRRGRTESVVAKDEHGAQLWRLNLDNGQWSQLYDSPLATRSDGSTGARDRSIRAACVHQLQTESSPSVYFAVGAMEGQVMFLRSDDGIDIEECDGQGFDLGDEDVPSARNLCGFGGKLYSTPTGRAHGGRFDDNLTDFPIVFETACPRLSGWRAVSAPGFGNPENIAINEIIAMGDFLYAMTANTRSGFEVWKTRPRGRVPYKWHKVLERGAFRPISSFPSVAYVFNGALYIGGTLQRQGKQGRDRFGPFGAELIRIYEDDSWDLVVGTPRFTPHGLKVPTSGMLDGFDDRFTHNFWRMAEYDGWLYLGTAGWKWLPTYLGDRSDLSLAQLERLQVETRNRSPGEFALWRTRDGDDWTPVTLSGFGGNPKNYGIREMVSTPHGLFVIPTATVGASGGGGLEIWQGSKNR